jgi:hypothetical protein
LRTCSGKKGSEPVVHETLPIVAAALALALLTIADLRLAPIVDRRCDATNRRVPQYQDHQ